MNLSPIVVWAFLLLGLHGSGTTLAALDVPPEITSILSADGTVGSPFGYQIVATNSPTSYSAVGVPSGLSFSATTGLISGNPTAVTGLYPITIAAYNAFGNATKTLNLAIRQPGYLSPFYTSGAQVSGTQGTPLFFATTIANLATEYFSSNLPLGLSIDGQSGIISGTPSESGTFDVVISVANPARPPASATTIIMTFAAAATTTTTTTTTSGSASSLSATASASASATTTGTTTGNAGPVAVPSSSNSSNCGLGGSMGALLVAMVLLHLRQRRP